MKNSRAEYKPFCKERGLSVCDRGKWGWEIYFYEDFTGTFTTGERENRIL